MITLILTGLLRGVRTQRSLVFENLALRHQLAVLQRTAPRPRLRTSDRLLWVLLSRIWSGWTPAVSVVQPATVIRWQRTGFKLVWTWKSRRNGPGRPAVALEVRALIRRMSKANPIWGAPRIHGELQKLGIEISQAAVSKYLDRRTKPPSQTWRSFLDNHLRSLVSVDFFIMPTVTFKVLFVFVVLAHERRRVVHINVTDTPPPSGRRSNSWRPAPGRLPRATSCAIAMRSTGSRSRAASRPWGSMKSRRRLGPLGRLPTWNGSSAPSAASASTTLWC
jgi:putative transposase